MGLETLHRATFGRATLGRATLRRVWTATLRRATFGRAPKFNFIQVPFSFLFIIFMFTIQSFAIFSR